MGCSGEFLKINSGKLHDDCTNIKEDMIVCLNRGWRCPQIQVAIHGDTCKKVASENGVTLTTFRKNNQLDENNCHITPGDVRVFFFFLSNIFFGFYISLLLWDSRHLKSDSKY